MGNQKKLQVAIDLHHMAIYLNHTARLPRQSDIQMYIEQLV